MGGKSRIGRARFTLLASSSAIALLIGGGAPAAFAQCSTSITGSVPGCTNSTTITGINIHSATVSGVINNVGVISPNGISLNTNSTINGEIASGGTIVGGISIDPTSTIAGGLAILITGTLSGGISNAGTISTTSRGILVSSVAQFGSTSAGGGIRNSGTISAGTGNAVAVSKVGTFIGGIGNSGRITAGSTGIRAISVSTFLGGISNSGMISASHIGMLAVSDSIFAGGMSNGGTITGPLGMLANSVSTFSGGMINTGMISGTGMRVENDATFLGGVTNTGTITGGKSGINAQDVTVFGGGMTNTGKISARTSGMYAFLVSTFTGGMTNTGTIMVAASGALFAIRLSTFSGGITNTGTLIGAGMVAGFPGQGIVVNFVSQFTGGITTSGMVSGAGDGIGLFSDGTFQGGITNSGTVLSNRLGIALSSSVQFGSTSAGGGITNSGTIAAGKTGVFIKNDGIFAGGLVNSGTITGPLGISISFVSTFAGGVTNSGVITGNTGILLGLGISTFAGAIANSGTIIGTGGTALDVSGLNNAVTINQTGGLISGAIKLSANADTLNISGGTINGNIVGQGADNINFALGAGTFTYASPFGFSGINQVNINSGTVVLNGLDSASKVAVNGGTLAGVGTLDPVVVAIDSGGTFAPGTPGVPGTAMTIAGNLAFQAGALYVAQINPATSTSATVSGTASLGGAVQAILQPGAYAKQTYTILHSAGLGGTTFAGFSVAAEPGFGGTLAYTPTDVLLSLTAQLGSGGGLGANQQSVAAAINNAFNGGATLPAAFFPLFGLSGASLSAVLSRLSGEVSTGGQEAAFSLMDSFMRLIDDPSSGSGGGTVMGFAPDTAASLPPDIALAYGAVLKAPPPVSLDQRWTAWGSSFGGSERTNGDPAAGTNTVSARAFGFAGGMDYHFTPDTVAGFALAGSGTNWSLAQALGTGRSDAFQAGVTAKTHFGPAYVAGALALTNNWMTTNRIAFGDQLTARFGAQSYGLRLEGGYRQAVPLTGAIVGIAPYAALQAQAFHTPSYSETDLTGGGFALSYNAMNATDTRSELGARFDQLQMLDGMPLTLRARAAWAHDWVTNPALSAIFQAIPAARFIVNRAAPPANSALATASAELQLARSWSVMARFDGEFAHRSQTYTGTGTLRYTW